VEIPDKVMLQKDTIIVIPARANSKRLPGKNIKLLGGKPLIAHSIEYALRYSAMVKDIIVTSDDDKVLSLASDYKVTPLKRPDALCGDHATTVSALQHVLETINDDTIKTVILLQPTNPLRPKDLLKVTFDAYKNSIANSLFTVSEMKHKLGKINGESYTPFNYTFGMRSQDMESLFYENGLLYITDVNAIKEGMVITENNLAFEVTHVFASIDIDTAFDFEYCTFILNTHADEI